MESQQSVLGLQKYTELSTSSTSEPHTWSSETVGEDWRIQRDAAVVLSQVCVWPRSRCNINSWEKVNPLKEEAKFFYLYSCHFHRLNQLTGACFHCLIWASQWVMILFEVLFWYWTTKSFDTYRFSVYLMTFLC